MRIAFDAKRVFHNTSGLGNYGRNLIRSLEANYPSDEYLLFTPRNGKVDFQPASARIIFPDTNLPALWRSFSIVRQVVREQPDIYHGLSNELPFTIASAGCRTAVSIHDVIFRRYPDAYGWIDRSIYDRKTRSALQRADVIFTSSVATAKDLEELYGADKEKMVVLYPGVESIFYDRTYTPEQLTGLPENFYLFVGLGNRRKNLEVVLEAMYRQQEEERIPLVVVGGKGAYAEAMKKLTKKLQLEKWLHFIQADNMLLRDLYRRAQALIYSSSYEGFGMPVAEALVCDCPVIASDRSSIPEAGGDAAIYFDPADPDSLKETMRRMGSGSERNACIEKGRSHRQIFAPDILAGLAMETYRSLL